MLLEALLAGAAGVLVGSLANRLIVREPGYVVTDPRDLPEVPVLAVLRPKTWWRRWFPVTELVMGAAFAVVVARLGWHPATPAVLFLAAALVTLAAVDLRVYRIPDRINFPSMAIGFATIAAAALLDGTPETIVGAVIGGFLYASMLFLAHIISPRGMGWGDVKLAWLMGFYLGWFGHEGGSVGEQVLGPLRAVLLGAAAGSVLGVLSGGGYAVVRRSTKVVFPYGPSLAAGCLIAVLWGVEPIWGP